jgi:hypothetical protein
MNRIVMYGRKAPLQFGRFLKHFGGALTDLAGALDLGLLDDSVV